MKSFLPKIAFLVSTFLAGILLIAASPIAAASPSLPPIAITESATVSSPENDQGPDVIVFVREGCPHCAAEEDFWQSEQTKDASLHVQFLRLEKPDQYKQWEDITARLELSKVTPITIIGKSVHIGFADEKSTGQEFLQQIKNRREKNIYTDLTTLTKEDVQAKSAESCPEGVEKCTTESKVRVPIFGEITPKQISLPLLASVLGFVDGFNPCAMWVLVSFLLILLQIGNRRRMALFAGIFILAEAIMYYFIMTTWYQVWNFIQLDQIVTPAVGIVAIGGGIFFLWQGRKAEQECVITDPAEHKKIRTRLQELAAAPLSLMTFGGILFIAFSVNIIEFACSIGIPQTFTKIMELNGLTWIQTQMLLFIYILFYMFDDFVVFGIALYAANRIGVTHKYARVSHWIGGILLLGLGAMLILKPDLLQFG